jgi:uncharacterized protein YkwD
MNVRLGVRAEARLPHGQRRSLPRLGRQELLLLSVAAATAAVVLATVPNASGSASAGGRRVAAVATKIVELPGRELLTGINGVRQSRGLRALTPSEQLARGARERAHSMAQEGYFGHVSPRGTPFWRDLLRYYGAAGFSRWSVGENLLWSVADVGAGAVVQEWLASPEHATVLLNRKWTQIGIDSIRARNAPGPLFSHRDVTIVVAEFGARIPSTQTTSSSSGR